MTSSSHHVPDPSDACPGGAGLQHPNIVPARDGGTRAGAECVAFAGDETLAGYLARAGRLPRFQGLALVLQLLSALEHAHGRGVVHLAIDPNHVLLRRTGQLQVFGFGGVPTASAMAAQPGDPGASRYLAPEQAVGARPDHRADLYSAALLARGLLAGALPDEVDGAAAGRAGLPTELDAVFRRALAQSPGARYRNAAEFSLALQAAVGTPVWVRPWRAAGGTGEALPEPGQSCEAIPQLHPEAVHAVAAARPRARRLGLAGVASCATAAILLVPWINAARTPVSELWAGQQLVATAGHAPARQEPVASQAPARLALTTQPAVAPVADTPAASPTEAPQVGSTAGAMTLGAQPGRPATAQVRAMPGREGIAARNGARLRGEARSNQQVRRMVSRDPRQSRRPGADLDCRQDTAIARAVCTAFRCATTEFSRNPVCVRIGAEQRARNQLLESLGGP